MSHDAFKNVSKVIVPFTAEVCAPDPDNDVDDDGMPGTPEGETSCAGEVGDAAAGEGEGDGLPSNSHDAAVENLEGSSANLQRKNSRTSAHNSVDDVAS